MHTHSHLHTRTPARPHARTHTCLAHRQQVVAQDVGGLLKQALGGGHRRCHFHGHAHALGALPREEEGDARLVVGKLGVGGSGGGGLRRSGGGGGMASRAGSKIAAPSSRAGALQFLWW